jgi:hypothetical protein
MYRAGDVIQFHLNARGFQHLGIVDTLIVKRIELDVAV